jgi:hypothetical protein
VRFESKGRKWGNDVSPLRRHDQAYIDVSIPLSFFPMQTGVKNYLHYLVITLTDNICPHALVTYASHISRRSFISLSSLDTEFSSISDWVPRSILK